MLSVHLSRGLQWLVICYWPLPTEWSVIMLPCLSWSLPPMNWTNVITPINRVMNIHNRVRRYNNINYATATKGEYERQRRATDAFTPNIGFWIIKAACRRWCCNVNVSSVSTADISPWHIQTVFHLPVDFFNTDGAKWRHMTIPGDCNNCRRLYTISGRTSSVSTILIIPL